ncbi:hypothetical protein A7U60_g7471 [Sanghuangporus baumii]|uniref:Uncharacterized protein n=1 Tax=Sanghuangporus baumii TaxID=108892 RepID=A0A9Q5HTB2_SANBA|nr:hypothetical protein A7U60_g7471 [Sanghuangporus baumii]
MKSKELSLSINIRQLHQNGRHKGRVKTWILVVTAILLAIGRLLLSTLRHPDVKQDEVSIVAVADSGNVSLGAFPNMSPKLMDAMFLGASDLPFLDSGSITAVFPVTENSLDEVHEIIELLTSDESSVSAIAIVCPESITPVLHASLLGRHQDTFMDMSVALWPEGLSEGPALMNVASSVSTEYALVVDSAGLGHLHDDSREHLLSHPLLLDLPTGFCGGNSTNVERRLFCVVPSSGPQPVSFLFPPFIIPSLLIRGFNATVVSDTDFWPSLGNALAQATGTRALIPESDDDSNGDWCRSLCKKYNLILDGSSRDQCTTPPDSEGTSDHRTDPSQSSSLAIILPILSDLEAFASVACRLSENGYTTHVLILSHDQDHASSESSFPWLHDHLISSICNISYSALHTSSNDFANAEAVKFWLDSANELMSVILYGSGGLGHVSELPFTAVLERQSAIGISVVQIPQVDLPYCDWLGSLSLQELRNWHMPDVQISVITDNRPDSLDRLFKSLQNAHYFGDHVSVRINVEQTADLETRRLVSAFEWNHGGVFVHHRVVHAGLLTAVVESWFPRSNHSYGVLLEDDVEVSPLFYAWIKMTLLRYRYGDFPNKRSALFGISLYQQKQIELRPEGRRPFDAQTLFDTYGILYRNTPYLSQIPCSWGAVYFPEHWREFHAYLMVRLSEAWLPLRDFVVPHVRSNRWAKSWKRFFIELVYLRGYVMLYPNYDDFVSLSTNHLEVGSHVKQQPRSIYEQKKSLFTLPLMVPSDGSDDSQGTGLLDLPEETLPQWSDLPVLDFWGTVSGETEVETRGTERQKKLVGCTTIGSLEERRRPFEAEELFTCIASVEENEVEDDNEFDSVEIHYDI